MTTISALPPPPSGGAGFTTEWPVRAGDVDRYGRLRLDSVARYLQDVAWDDLCASGFVDSDPTWIVRRTLIDVITPIRWPERVTLRRWCSGLSTRWANMRVRITSDGGGLVETEAFWIKIDEKSGATARISDTGFAHLAATTDEHRLRWRPMLEEEPPASSRHDIAYPIRTADIDVLMHMNNAAYWQVVEDFLPDSYMDLVGPYRAIIEYRAPISAKQSLYIRSDVRSTVLRLWFIIAGAANADCLVTPLPVHSIR